jgi:competence protein ComEC
MRDPLVLPLAAFCAGVLLARLDGITSRESVVALAAFGVLTTLSRTAGSRRLARFCGYLCFACAGAGSLAWKAERPLPRVPPPGIHRLEGCVATAPELRNGRERFVLELDSGAGIRLSRAVPQPAETELRAGDRIVTKARLSEPARYRNPGAFDYGAWLRRRGILATGVVDKSGEFQVFRAGCGVAWPERIENLRARSLARLDELYEGDAYAQGMMRGLLLGDSSGIRDAWVEGFRRTGTYHALVISGSHVTFLAGLLLIWVRWVKFGRGYALAGAAGLAWLYALVAGGDPPVVRAAAGFTLYVIAKLIFRPTRLLNLTAGIALIFLALDPEQLFDASFQLSFLAVGAIGAFGQPLIERSTSLWREAVAQKRGAWPLVPENPRSAALRVELQLLAETIRAWTRIPLKWCWAAVRCATLSGALAAETAIVSGVIQVALALPMILYFHRLSLSGLSANVLAVPLVTLAIPAGFLGLFTWWRPAADAALWLLEAGRRIIEWHSRLEPERRVPDPPSMLSLAFCSSLVLLALALRRRSRLAPLAASAVTAILISMVAIPFPPKTAPARLEVTAIDVGQGDSFFLGFPDGSTGLIDTGGLPNWAGRRSEFDIGEEVVAPYLWSRGVRRLDLVVLTHLHYDHAGSAASVIRNFRPRMLWMSALEDPHAAARIGRIALAAGASVRRLKQGEELQFGGVRWTVLAPFERALSRLERENQSLFLAAEHGSKSFLFTADTEAVTQARLVEARRLRRADVLKVPHHGSRRAALPEFLDSVRPAFALISAGRANRFGHPHPEVVQALAARGAQVLRTDLDGLITILSDGRRLEVLRTTRGAPIQPVWEMLD